MRRDAKVVKGRGVLAGGVPALPRTEALGDRLGEAHPAILLPRKLQLAHERAEWLGARLAEQIEREGMAGVVGEVLAVSRDGSAVATSEALRALFVAERDEREHVEALAERIARLGLDQRDTLRDVATWVSAALKSMTAELGLSFSSDPLLRTARRAIVVSRRATGHQDGDPDQADARITASERVEVLREALARAEREVALQEGTAPPRRPASPAGGR